jgi:rhomboid-related protein 1/2/3
MDFGWIRVLGFSVLFGTDVGVAIYYRYNGVDTKTGYAAHLAGGLAGFLLGIVVLRNLKERKWEWIVWWMSLVLFVAGVLAMVVWNIANPSHFPALQWS